MPAGCANKKNQIITFFCDKLLTYPPDEIPALFAGTYAALERGGAVPGSLFFFVDFLQKLSGEFIKAGAFQETTLGRFATFLESSSGRLDAGLGDSGAIGAFADDLRVIYARMVRESISFDARTCEGLVADVDERIRSFTDALTAVLPGARDTLNTPPDGQFEKWLASIRENEKTFVDRIAGYFGTREYTVHHADVRDAAKAVITRDGLSDRSARSPGDSLIAGLLRTMKDFSFIVNDPGDGRSVAFLAAYDYPALGLVSAKKIFLVRVPDGRGDTAADSSFCSAAIDSLRRSNDCSAASLMACVAERTGHIISACSHDDGTEAADAFISVMFPGFCRAMDTRAALFMAQTPEGDLAYCSSCGLRSTTIERLKALGLPEGDLAQAVAAAIAGKGAAICRPAKVSLTLDGENAFPEALVAPLSDGQRCLGVLIFTSASPAHFDASHRLALDSVAAPLSSNMAMASRYATLRRAVIEIQNRQENLIHDEKFKLLGEIATGIAHNFNNLMAVILGRVGLLQRAMKDEKAVASLNIIESTIREGEEIIKRLQAFIPKKNSTGPFARVNLNRILNDAMEIVVMRCHAEEYLKNVSYDFHTEISELPETYAIADEIQEVIISVAFNAIEAMGRGGDIFIRSFLAPDASAVCVSIRDTGPGMSREVQQKLFIPFFTTKGQVGTGLGLSYSYGIILKHRGNIKVKSAPGKGTEIVISLPVVSEASDVPSRLIAGHGGGNFFGTVLIVDDDEKMRTALADIIRILGHTVYSAASATEAFDIVRNGRTAFDLVFTDFKMPDATGMEVARFIKGLHPQMPIGLITAYSYSIDREELENGLFDVIIGKPFNLNMIESTITALLKKKKKEI